MMIKKLVDLDTHLTESSRLSPGSNHLWRVMAFLAHSGDSWFWFIGLLILWVSTSGDWHSRSAVLAIGVAILAVLVLGIKFSIRRSRPMGEWGSIYRNTDPHSFPSGHAARAFMLLAAGWGLGPIWFSIILTVWAPLVSLARVKTGLHYFSDIVAGAIFGVIAGIILLASQPLLYAWFPFLF